MKIYLLTHARELTKKSNTGQLALSICPELVRRVVWSRVSPSTFLVDALSRRDAALIYPSKNVIAQQLNPKNSDLKTHTRESLDGCSVSAFNSFVIVDATWQAARKIVNQSDYLKTASTVTLYFDSPSLFTRRKNQQPGGVCTAECVIDVLTQKGYTEKAGELQSVFEQFNRQC